MLGAETGKRVHWRARALMGLSFGSLLGAAAFLEVQLWQDTAFRSAWRLQQQHLTGRCRLLAPDGNVRAQGFGDACEPALAEAAQGAAEAGEDLVILLHGLGRTPEMFRKLRAALAAPGRKVVALRYPSIAQGISEHGDWLNRLLRDHPPVQRVSFVTHSLGGLVLRAALGQGADWQCRLPVGTVVMLAPPNQGALLARKLDAWTPIRWVLGPSFDNLAGRGALPPSLPEELPLAVIAGGNGTQGFNPLLPGDDDGVVLVAETSAAGAEIELRVPALHTFIANDPEAIAATRSFLDSPLETKQRPADCPVERDRP